MRRGKTRMFDRELQKASRFEDAVGFTENPAGFRNIHETHKADGKIKPGIGEWKLDRARDPVVYPQRFFFFRLLRVLDKDFRNIPIRLKQVARLLREGGGHGRRRPAWHQL